MISVNEAKKIINSKIFTLGTEKINIKDSINRILSEDIFAKFPHPRFDNSAMDGFAVKSIDTKGASKDFPVKLNIKGTISAGLNNSNKMNHSECYQIMTGAEIPTGADAVVIVENSSGFTDTNLVNIYKEVKVNENIRLKAEEIKKNAIILENGQKIGPYELANATSFGYEKISVYQKPKISIFTTGNELVLPGAKLKSGQIYNSNLFLLVELAKNIGLDVEYAEILKDDEDELKNSIINGLKKSDIIISSGGISMGKYDFLKSVYEDIGVEQLFHKISQKPGKPMFCGVSNKKFIFGLPGNPISCLICFLEYIWPLAEKMMGNNFEHIYKEAELTNSFPIENNKHRFLLGKVFLHKNKLYASPSKKIGSHMLSSTIDSNAILMSNPCLNKLEKGDKIKFKFFPWMNL